MFEQFTSLCLNSEWFLFIAAVKRKWDKFLGITPDQLSFCARRLHQIQTDWDDNLGLVLDKDVDVRLFTSKDDQNLKALRDELFNILVKEHCVQGGTRRELFSSFD